MYSSLTMEAVSTAPSWTCHAHHGPTKSQIHNPHLPIHPRLVGCPHEIYKSDNGASHHLCSETYVLFDWEMIISNQTPLVRSLPSFPMSSTSSAKGVLGLKILYFLGEWSNCLPVTTSKQLNLSDFLSSPQLVFLCCPQTQQTWALLTSFQNSTCCWAEHERHHQ